MAEPDLSRLPRGEMGWGALLDYVVSTDDRVERHFLEVKSDVDLNEKAGRTKVAKFILGAANRDPQKAQGRFDGHAVMLLGVGGGARPGITGFEAMDLAREVKKFIGAEGPRWDYDRLPSDVEGRDVIAVVVDPPTGQLWTCLADGAGLHDGDIFVREDGETRKASGSEVRAMVERVASGGAREVDVEVAAYGHVFALDVPESAMVDIIESEVATLLDTAKPTQSKTFGDPYVASFQGERRSREAFAAEVKSWGRTALTRPMQGLYDFAGYRYSGVAFGVVNRTRTFLKRVRLDIELDPVVRAVDWADPEEKVGKSVLLPDRPLPWGRDTALAAISIPRDGYQLARDPHGAVEITSNFPARLTVLFDELRPLDSATSDNNDVVLIVCPVPAGIDEVAARWKMTAADVDDVFEGEVSLSLAQGIRPTTAP